MAIIHDTSRKGLPTDDLEDRFAALRAEEADLHARMTSEPWNAAPLRRMDRIRTEMEETLREITARAVGIIARAA